MNATLVRIGVTTGQAPTGQLDEGERGASMVISSSGNGTA
jgi:hypothetical protein